MRVLRPSTGAVLFVVPKTAERFGHLVWGREPGEVASGHPAAVADSSGGRAYPVVAQQWSHSARPTADFLPSCCPLLTFLNFPF